MEQVETAYEAFDIPMAQSYSKDIEKGKYIKDNIDIKSKRANNGYNSYIDKLIKFKPKEYFQDSFNSLTESEVIDISFSILLYIFKDEKLVAEVFSSFLDVLHISKDNSILSGGSFEITRNGITKRFVELPSINNTSSIVSLIHEFIHYFCGIYDIDTNRKFYYRELLSIYAEKVAIHFIEKQKLQSDIKRKIEETRLEGIVWHYTIGLEDYNTAKKLYNKIKNAPDSHHKQQYLANLVRDMPFLVNKELDKKYVQYRKALSESYGIGYLYAENLFKIFLEQNEKNDKINGILTSKLKLQDVLDFYNINCENHLVYQPINQKLKKLRR